jgi:hypothetical protein
VTSEFQPALARHDSRLQLRLGPGPVEVEVDPERVAQIMRILIDNALAHTPRRHRHGRDDPARQTAASASRSATSAGASSASRSTGSSSRSTAPATARAPASAWRSPARLADRMDGELTVEPLAGRTTFTLELPA